MNEYQKKVISQIIDFSFPKIVRLMRSEGIQGSDIFKMGKEFENALIEELLILHNGNISKVAHELNLNRNTVSARLTLIKQRKES